MKISPRSKLSGQILVIVIIVLVLLGIAYWWLDSNKRQMMTEGREFGTKVIQEPIHAKSNLVAQPVGKATISSTTSAGQHGRKPWAIPARRRAWSASPPNARAVASTRLYAASKTRIAVLVEEGIGPLVSRWLIRSGTEPAANEERGGLQIKGAVLGWRRSDAHSPQADGSDRRGD